MQINSLAKFKNVIFAATNSGLRKDDGTFYGSGSSLSLVDIFGDENLSQTIVVNDISASDSSLAAGISDGRLAILDSNGWAILDDLPLKSIHKVLIIDGRIWVFGFNLLVVIKPSSVGDLWQNFDTNAVTTFPLVLTTGIPL